MKTVSTTKENRPAVQSTRSAPTGAPVDPHKQRRSNDCDADRSGCVFFTAETRRARGDTFARR